MGMNDSCKSQNKSLTAKHAKNYRKDHKDLLLLFFAFFWVVLRVLCG